MPKTLIIAEAGVNHNGCVKTAMKLVDAAKQAGADIVKFQTFKTDLLVTSQAEQAKYQIENTEKKQSQSEMLKKLELTFAEHQQVRKYCHSQDIIYLSTAFDSESLIFLTKDLDLPFLKVPSGEITNAPFLLQHALTGADLIVSTGMANIEEIEQALAVIAFGYLHINDQELQPDKEKFKLAFESMQGQAVLKEKVTLLHCTTEYPAPLEQINLNAMKLMKEHFDLPIGYSDHTEGILVSTAAVACGAVVIEKHFTLSRDMDGPDHKASLEPAELKQMVEDIRQVEKALGVKIKQAAPCELKNIAIARKSIVAKQAIKKGESYSEQNLAILRAGAGLSPMHYYEILHQRAVRDYQAGELISLDS